MHICIARPTVMTRTKRKGSRPRGCPYGRLTIQGLLSPKIPPNATSGRGSSDGLALPGLAGRRHHQVTNPRPPRPLCLSEATPWHGRRRPCLARFPGSRRAESLVRVAWTVGIFKGLPTLDPLKSRIQQQCPSNGLTSEWS